MVTLRDQNAIVEAPATWYNRALAKKRLAVLQTDTKQAERFA
jgi:hypothetical protein